MSKENEISLFDHLNRLTDLKIPLDENNDEHLKNYKPYLLNRYISMCSIYIPYVNEINKYNLDKSVHNKYFLNLLPKRKQFFKYISKKKDINLDIKQKLAEYFQISLREVDEYVKILSENQFKEICSTFDYGKKS